MADGNMSASGPAAVLGQLRALWTKQSRGRRMLAIGAVLAIAAVVAVASLAKHETAWAAVAEGASPDDAQELLATLETKNLPVRLVAGKVEVPTERLDEARAAAAAAGLPRTGKGFELFDGASLGQSSFAEQVNYRRALEGELARSIAALAQVQGARVHLALGKRSVFKEQEEKASASVALHLHGGQTLTAEQVRGVRELVAASVDGMQAGSVVIVDNHGNLLDAGSSTPADKRADLENTLTVRVRTMLERVVGAGKVSVVTTAVVDDSKVSETQETYDQEHPALRSESRTLDGPGATSAATMNANASGVAGTAGPLQGNGAGAGAGGAGGKDGHLQETKNYEVNHTVRQTQKPESQLERLHVAIVVDYKTGPDGKPAARTADELGELIALARQAAGIDDARGDKIEMRSIPFAVDPEIAAAAAALAGKPAPVAAKLPVLYIGAGAGALVVLGAVVMFVRARKRRAVATRPMTFSLPAPVRELERVLDTRAMAAGSGSLPALGAGDAAAPPALPPGKSVRDRVLDAVRGDVERTAEVLTSWLSEIPAVAPGTPVAKTAKS